MRKAYNFYRSHYEQTKLLNKTQKCDIFTAICEVQFLEKHIDDIVFVNKITQLVWVGVKHSLQTSIDGYCSKMKIDYGATLTKGNNKEVRNKGKDKSKEKIKEKIKDKEEEKEEKTSFDLSAPSKIESDSQAVASHLLQKILKNKPNFKKPVIAVWEKDIEKAINHDGRTVEELLGCIDWIYSSAGTFWIPNVLSAKKLREKFDVMESQMINNPENKSRTKIAHTLAKGGY